MPFRASFYEHFGYGIVERRNEWTLPLAVLPHGPFDGFRVYEPGDLSELVRFRRRVVERGQCDFERSEAAWRYHLARAEAGFVVVDRPNPNGPIHGFIFFEHTSSDGTDVLRVSQSNWEDVAALKRQFHFFASLKDQYGTVVLPLPTDLPINWLLKEAQLPHRSVNHAAAGLRQQTRMQLRILDHARFLQAMTVPVTHRRNVVVAVHETEGSVSRFSIDLYDGKMRVSASDATPQFSCRDTVWAAVATGTLPASRAAEFGLAEASDARTLATLDVLSEGPAAFSHEYF